MLLCCFVSHVSCNHNFKCSRKSLKKGCKTGRGLLRITSLQHQNQQFQTSMQQNMMTFQATLMANLFGKRKRDGDDSDWELLSLCYHCYRMHFEVRLWVYPSLHRDYPSCCYMADSHPFLHSELQEHFLFLCNMSMCLPLMPLSLGMALKKFLSGK